MVQALIEENGVYKIEVGEAVWSLGTLGALYSAAKVELSDVDFIIETKEDIYFGISIRGFNYAKSNTKQNKN